tara:strand:+ start:1556 stop:2137 length:582 start_codon:yes stop_codon:yes gene_type:complete
MNLDFFIVLTYSYLLGSIPFGLVLTKLFLKQDIRNFGSGNIGTTNVLRTGKKALALSTLILDVLKGYISVTLTINFFENFTYLAALTCFIAHIFPIWLKFKGGKGVAPYLGIILAISLKLAIIFGVVWLITILLFRYASLSSILSSLIILIYGFFLKENYLIIFLIITFIMITYTHRENIVRLKNSKESKIKL